MTDNPKTDADGWLNQMLEDVACAPVPEASPDLMARVLADAEQLLPAPGGVPAAVPFWKQIVDGLGGWSAMGGLAFAGVTGLAIGLGVFDASLDAPSVDALWSFDIFDEYDSQTGLAAFGWDFEEG